MATRIRILVLGLVGGLLALPVGAAAAKSQILWSRNTHNDNRQQIVSAHANGSGLIQLSHPHKGARDIDAQFSPDGSQVVYERDFDDESIAAQDRLVDAEGENDQLLDLGCVDPCVVDSAPTWTLDAGRIAYSPVVGPFDQVNDSATSAVLQTSGLDGSDPMRLSESGIDGVYEDYHARFSPDGGYVVFTRIRNEDIKAAAFRMALDGTNVVQLTPWKLGADLADLSPATSGPTKDLVVFETYGTGPPKGKTQNIVTVPTTCGSVSACKSKLTYLTHRSGGGPRASFNPAWSPNGRKIAYTEFSLEDKHGKCCVGDIWKMRADGSHKRPVSQSTRFEYRPDWAPAAP